MLGGTEREMANKCLSEKKYITCQNTVQYKIVVDKLYINLLECSTEL